MFDLKQIRCFVAVGEELHFGRAAKRLYMSQPPLSRQIQILEHQLDVQLLSRTSRSVILTPAGVVFLHEARRLLAIAENAAHQAQRISRGESGLMRLGFTAGSSYSFLPKMLAQLETSLRGVDIELHEMVTKQQVESLESLAIDVGLLRSTTHLDDLETLCVAREQMMLAVPTGHRLARGRTPRFTDLKNEPFITFSPLDGQYFYGLIDQLFNDAAIPTCYVQKVSQIHSILALVSARQGIALVPESARALHFTGTIMRRIKMQPVSAELYLAWKIDNKNPVLPIFHKIAAKHFSVGLANR
jgi:DNA-binding transcriptional LysR family regulator